MKTRDDYTLPGLVHDLNNVFQTLVDAADMLSAEPRWAKLSAAILRSVERGKKIAASIHAESTAGVPFEQILANAMTFVEDSIAAGGGPPISFSFEVEPGIEVGWAWERVLLNLFLNAMRAMPEGGAISIRARYVGGNAEIVVRDEGSGIAPEVLDHMFQPHVSGNASSGLGLHIVESIVIRDGGRVSAANRTDGPGAEFTIVLPIHAPLPSPQLRVNGAAAS